MGPAIFRGPVEEVKGKKSSRDKKGGGGSGNTRPKSTTWKDSPAPTNNRYREVLSARSKPPAHAYVPPASSNVGDAHEQNRTTLPGASAPSFELGDPHPRNNHDTQEQPTSTNPNSNNRTQTKDPPRGVNDQVEATSSESVHLFGQAHDISISGGEFYTAARIDIDASHNKGACTQSTSVSNLWQLNHTCHLLENGGEHIDRHVEASEGGGKPSLSARTACSNSGTADGEKGMASLLLEGENEYCSPAIDSPGGLFEGGPEEHHEQDLQNLIISSAATSSAATSSAATSSLDPTIADDVIYGILSNYPRRPIRNHRSFEHILQALIVSFSPLSSVMIAALFDLSDAHHVEQILLPARPLVFAPKSEVENGENPNRNAVRFICSSIAEFLLDRTRGREYFVDTPSAHRTMLDGCTLVLEKAYLGEQKFQVLGHGWKDAYLYACQNWERHRRAGTRSKL